MLNDRAQSKRLCLVFMWYYKSSSAAETVPLSELQFRCASVCNHIVPDDIIDSKETYCETSPGTAGSGTDSAQA